MTEEQICRGCEKPIKEGEKVISVDLGDMEYHVDKDYAYPINQSSESKGYWHEGCFPEGIISD